MFCGIHCVFGKIANFLNFQTYICQLAMSIWLSVCQILIRFLNLRASRCININKIKTLANIKDDNLG